MKLELLLRREPIDMILEKSIEHYLFQKYNSKFTVHWSSNFENSINRFLVNPALNLIFPINSSKSEIYPYVSQYTCHPHIISRLIKKLYCKLSLSKIFRCFFSSYQVSITPWIPDFDNMLIMGSNHSFSIINIDENTTTQIAKFGFDDTLIKNSIKIRLNNPELPVPPICEFDINKNYITQKWISGIPLNRIITETKFNQFSKFAINSILALNIKTQKQININKWVENIISRIEISITNLPIIYDSCFKARLISLAYKLSCSIKEISSIDTNIFTSMTHGDFDNGNIIIKQDLELGCKIYIIDWDHCDRRFILYDVLVNKLKSHTLPTGLIERIFLEIDFINAFKLSGTNNNYKCCDNLTPRQIIDVFLLEDLLFRIKENCLPFFRSRSPGLESYLKELDLYLN